MTVEDLRRFVRGEIAHALASLDIGREVALDSHTPHTLTIDPLTGLSAYDFDGHVHALGLDIDAGVSATPPDDNRVRWLRAGDGTLIGALFAYELGNLDVLYLSAMTDAAGTGYAILHAERESVGPQQYAQLQARVQPSGVSSAEVSVQNEGGVSQDAVLLRGDGRSTFLGPGARVAVVQNEPAIGGGFEATVDLALPAGTCLLNDKVVAINPAALTAGVVVKRVHPVAPAADTARVILLNTTGAATVAVSRTWHVWVLTQL